MKLPALLPLGIWLLCGCAPGSSGPKASPAPISAPVRSAASVAGTAKAAAPDGSGPSYEVSIASAQADRVRARDQCDSRPKVERQACREAAENAYDEAKSAAEAANTPVSR